jgi:glutathione peroxidase
MAGLQGLEEKLSADGLQVLGFLSNDFGNQGGDPGQVDACTDKYNVTFDQFAIDHVKGANAQPVFSWLLAQPNPGPASMIEPEWNFNKYLISREGKLVAHWNTPEYPGDDPDNPNDNFDTNPIVMAIKAELAK